MTILWIPVLFPNLPLEMLPEPKRVLAVDGSLLAAVTHRTEPISLLLSGNHHETIRLFPIAESLAAGIIQPSILTPWGRFLFRRKERQDLATMH